MKNINQNMLVKILDPFLASLDDETLNRMMTDIKKTLDNAFISKSEIEILNDWYFIIQNELDGFMPSTELH
jgi:hypothetical protein